MSTMQETAKRPRYTSDISNKGFQNFTTALNQNEVEYVLIGRYTVILHGYGRNRSFAFYFKMFVSYQFQVGLHQFFSLTQVV